MTMEETSPKKFHDKGQVDEKPKTKKKKSKRSASPSKKKKKKKSNEKNQNEGSLSHDEPPSSSSRGTSKTTSFMNQTTGITVEFPLGGDSSLSSSRAPAKVDERDQDLSSPKSFWHRWDVTPAEDALFFNSFLERESKRVARCPCTYFWVALVISLALSFIALIVGEFEVSAETGGWQSRGTLIADRQTQAMLATEFQTSLFYGGDEAWEELINNVQPGWETEDDDSDDRRLSERKTNSLASKLDIATPTIGLVEDHVYTKARTLAQKTAPFFFSPDLQRRLQESSETEPALAGCDLSFYDPFNMTYDSRLWPTWKVVDPSKSALDVDVLRDLCVAEQNTQDVLVQKGLCFGCENGCLPPFSLVFYARLVVVGGFSMDCDELSAAWAPLQDNTQTSWQGCIKMIKATYDPNNEELPDSCPFGFYPTLIQGDFDETMVTSFTSSIFATLPEDVDELYENVDSFDRAGETIEGAYDTQYEDFIGTYLDASLGRDMSLALGSAVVVCVAIIIHTRSPLITVVGLLQIILSFPLSYFVYKLVAGLDFFPFLNFIGIFVVFALGAGDIFVAIDKWKNARISFPSHTYSTEYVAAKALPDAANAMFLTTITTAIAFFATAICPVAPIKMFAIFCGLLILFDYIMNVLLVFPVLCIYDKAMIAREAKDSGNGCFGRCWSCCLSCSCFGVCGPTKQELDDLEGAKVENHGVTASNFIRTQSRELELVQEDEKEAMANASFIQRIMLGFYALQHKLRWILFVVCLASLGICVYYATTLELPTSSDVRLLDPDHEYERSFEWRQFLLSEQLEKLSGSNAYVIWGVTPADTGDQNNPARWSQLVLDDAFDASPEDAQTYLRYFCDDLFAEVFASEVDDEFVCPMTRFDEWLAKQAALDSPDSAYVEYCASASSIPVPQASFHACMSHWASSVDETSVLSRNGIVKIMFVPFNSRVRYDAFYDILKTEWELVEEWMTSKNAEAPGSVNKGFFSSFDFWWYDTNGQMLSTAYSGAAIALAASAGVILLSSRSIILTLFSTITIGFVLTSVTAVLVAIGWTLGFLESICFAILIGVSVDFVIHLAHAYSHKRGEINRGDRTKYSLVKMGPSILATAITTILSAVVMLFTVITFFQKFALILLFTIIMASLGSFIFLVTLLDCIGPTNPSFLADKCMRMCSGKANEDHHDTVNLHPSGHDIVIGKGNHPGTKAFAILVREYIRKQKKGSKPPPPFCPKVRDAILEELRHERKKVKGPAPKVLFLELTEGGSDGDVFRVATKSETTDFIRACYVGQISPSD